MTDPDIKPVTLLICAMGGEGGGLLMKWIVNAAMSLDLPVQSTSVPGVAQRTGATTYYIEIYPRPRAELAGREPVLSLYPGLGDLDLVVASELVEVGRALQRGYVHPERSTLIGSTHRVYSIAEKSAGDDGRFDTETLLASAPDLAARTILFDIAAAARESGCILNAVMLGAIAGSGVLPIPVEVLQASIGAGGKAVEANLKGFACGLSHARGEVATEPDDGKSETSVAPPPTSFATQADSFPASLHPIIFPALNRLVDYQGWSYAQLYLDRLKGILEAGGDAAGAAELGSEVARVLALWMSYEDLIRVAQLKTRRDRLEELRSRGAGSDGSIVTVTEYLKPGIDELCSVLPPILARSILRVTEKWRLKPKAETGLRLKTSTVSGFLSLWVLSKLRPLRRMGYRYQQEQLMIDVWLDLVRRAVDLDLTFALEVARCARLIKGYGATHDQGVKHYQKIVTDLIEPVLVEDADVAAGSAAVAKARDGALSRPEAEIVSYSPSLSENTA